MKFGAIFAVISLLLLGLCTGKKSQSTATDNRYQQLSDLSAKSKGNVVTLDDSTYFNFAIAKPRPYSLIVFLTAAHPKFKCSICKQLDSELALLATSYANQIKSSNEDQTVFFAKLDYESAQKVFQNYEVKSVPLLFHIPANVGSSDTAGKEYHILHRDKYQPSQNPDAESIASFLNDRTGISVQIKRSMLWSYVLLIVVFGILAALVRPVINALPTILNIMRVKPLWGLVSIGFYTISISGLIFDIIRSPQMYYANPNTGQIMFFYPQSGNQFVVEGFVIGFLNLVCAASAIYVAAYVPKIKDEQFRMMGATGGVIAFFVSFRMVRSLYVMKNPWYGSRH